VAQVKITLFVHIILAPSLIRTAAFAGSLHLSEPDPSSEYELWPGTGEPQRYEEVSVLFTDFVGFTTVSEKLTPQQLVDELHTCFTAFDGIMAKHKIEKIKTVGDAYLFVNKMRDGIVVEGWEYKTMEEALEAVRLLSEQDAHADS